MVLRTGSTVLYDRLKSRQYPEKKLQENMDSEIMEVLLEEAREAYATEIVIELQSDDAEDLESNVERVEQWIKHWQANRVPLEA